jgi:membrane-bound lytic murein transglycosylase B
MKHSAPTPGPQHARPSVLTPSRRCIVGTAAAVVAGAAVICGAAVAGGSPAPHVKTRAAAVLDQRLVPSDDAGHPGPDSTQRGSVATVAPASPPEFADVAAVSNLAASGIPSTALAAYQNAAAREAVLRPSCGLTWPLLAGIGRVESNHGRFAGAVLHTDGVSTPPIIGIPLNGNGTALIRDTDGGRLDGDVVYDRAVGPMQFIPSTWAGWGVDANQDGVRDPFNIFDAAAASADYLCAAGRDLTTADGQVAAILSYNHSYDYVDMVMGLEKEYAAGVGAIVPVLPAASTPHEGPPSTPPTLPPVDPGKPRGTETPPGATPSASTTASTASGTSSNSGPPGAGAPSSSPPGEPPPGEPPSQDSPVGQSPTAPSCSLPALSDSPGESSTPDSPSTCPGAASDPGSASATVEPPESTP